ncbi:MAG: Clp protease N-terminal domain-containing protein, partial [Acidimicrobiales bacterium]
MERLGERAGRVDDAAIAEARRMGHPYVGTEHLLLGLLSVEGPARDALRRAGVTAEAARAKVIEAVGDLDQSPSHAGARPRQPVSAGTPDFSDRARRALERASRLSLHRRDPDVEPEHVLVGLLDVEGRAGQVLRGLGVDMAALQRDAELRVGEDFDAEPEPPSPPLPPPNMAGPHCAH